VNDWLDLKPALIGLVDNLVLLELWSGESSFSDAASWADSLRQAVVLCRGVDALTLLLLRQMLSVDERVASQG
jgi:hypothetical protein